LTGLSDIICQQIDWDTSVNCQNCLHLIQGTKTASKPLSAIAPLESEDEISDDMSSESSNNDYLDQDNFESNSLPKISNPIPDPILASSEETSSVRIQPCDALYRQIRRIHNAVAHILLLVYPFLLRTILLLSLRTIRIRY
jgi:hypothetical protein